MKCWAANSLWRLFRRRHSTEIIGKISGIRVDRGIGLGSQHIDASLHFAIRRSYVRDHAPVAGSLELVEARPMLRQVRRLEQIDNDRWRLRIKD